MKKNTHAIIYLQALDWQFGEIGKEYDLEC